jgi:Anti-sigma-D factor RsdA to sigma factor binding region
MPDFGRWTSNGGDPSLNEINRTDRFLDALASQQPVYSTDPSEAELAQLLAGWRDEVRTPPLMAPVTPRDASMALRRAVETRKRNWMSLTIVGSVAAAVLCLGGFGAVVAGAGPGDALYGLRTMLFGEQQTTRDDAVMLASQQLAEVQQLINEGQWDAAQDKLQTLTTTVATVNDVEQKQELANEWRELSVKVENKDPAATVPPDAPPATLPEPVVIAPGSSTTTPPSDTTTSSSETTTSSSETTTSSSETTTSSSETTSSSTSTTTSSPVQEPPPVTSTPTTTPPTTTPPTTTPPTTTTTTTTHAITTTTSAAGVPAVGGPAAGGGAEVVAPPTASVTVPTQAATVPSQVVAPPTSSVEVTKQRGPETPVQESSEVQATVTIPVTTTPVVQPPKKSGDGE